MSQAAEQKPDFRAAQYVRASTEHQQYSTENQADKIKEYAEHRNMEIVCTYSDDGKSGLSIGGRASLKKLIADVEAGDVDFNVILVYDVSRWGRFQDIRSTGLSGALGIARHVFALYGGMGPRHTPLENPAIPRANVLAQNGPRDWKNETPGEIVCHCELVTLREIEAALHGPLAARSLAGLKRQTRVTMGRCQGFYCTARLAELTEGHFVRPMSRENGHA